MADVLDLAGEKLSKYNTEKEKMKNAAAVGDAEAIETASNEIEDLLNPEVA